MPLNRRFRVTVAFDILTIHIINSPGHCFLSFEITFFLLQIATHLQCNCVLNCNKLLQICTHMQCDRVPICNKLLQIGTHLQCYCVPICNNI